jgi:Plavaka transposase
MVRFLFILNIFIANFGRPGKPCQQDGSYPMGGERLHLPSPPDADSTDWGAFESKEGFQMAELVYHMAHMSAGNIDNLFKISHGKQVPFSNHEELYMAIDGLTVGGVAWQSFSIQYNGERSDDTPQPKWMSDIHEVFYRDPRLVVHEMLANLEFKNGMDFVPYCAFDKDGVRMYQHLMSRDWAWEQAVSLFLQAFG